MKLRVAYGLSVIMVLSFIMLRRHALTSHIDISNRIKKEQITKMHEYDGVVRDSVVHDEIVNLQDFVFFDNAELLNFEDNKKERARCLLEQLCGGNRIDGRQMNIQRNLFFTRIPLRAIAMRNNVCVHSKQQFGIPQVAGKNMLVKKIVTKQLSEKNLFPKKRSMLSALEKLLE